MNKYETTIKIRSREKNADLLTVLENLFYRKPELAKKALEFVYLVIEDKRVPDSSWAEVMKKIGCTHQEYYTLLGKMRDAGLITKKEGYWFLSEQFANRCQEMTDIWSSFIKRWKSAR